MCGRKTLTKGKIQILEAFLTDEWESDYTYVPSYNIAPTNIVPILLHDKIRKIKPMHWGLIPNWAKDRKFAAKMINARRETLTEKQVFSQLLSRNRCVVISDGYFEWKKSGKSKQPYYIYRKDNGFLPMAGLWSKWNDENNQSIFTYTIITTEPTKELNQIHNRMPVILKEDDIDTWLKCKEYKPEKALKKLHSFPDLNFYPVSKFVNSIRNNSEECIRKMGRVSLGF